MKKYNRYMMRLLQLCAFVLVFVVGGCSVKEDRMVCPCRLVLDLTDADTLQRGPLHLVVLSGERVVHSDTLEDVGGDYVVDVPHGDLTVNVWKGDSDLSIPYGCECPALYMDSFVADTRCERYCRKVDLNKNHCLLTVLVEGVERVPYSLTLRGNVSGYGLDGRPSPGEFSCVAYPGEDGGSQVQLPRQVDNSLMLEVDDGASAFRVFALGEYLAAGGYDWGEENLQDVTVVLDYFVTYVKILVEGWEEEHTYNVIL